MKALLDDTLLQEIQDITLRHIDELQPYTGDLHWAEQSAPGHLLTCIEQLAAICEHRPETAVSALYSAACHHKATIEEFLQVMNQPFDTDFLDSQLGQIWALGNSWCATAGQNFRPSIDTVWDIIAPAVPDSLEEVSDGIYEARWWPPVPMMDVELLRHTEGVILHNTPPVTPRSTTLCIRFSIELSAEHS